MNVYVFGNEDFEGDKVGIEVANKLQGKIDDVKFIFVKPNEDAPFIGEAHVVILDAIEGTDEIVQIGDDKIDDLILPPRSTAHDFDLSFQLKYLKKLGKIGKVTIIGLPMKGKIDYFLIQSILRKLVAQDMQGS